MTVGKLIDGARKRMDSWYNALTGLGSALRDKQTYTRFLPGVRLDYTTMEALYHENDMAAKICEALPEEGLRKGFYLSAEEDSHEIDKALYKYGKKLGFDKALLECAIWSRVFGGAVIYLGVDDGREESKEINIDSIKSVNFVHVIDRRHITAATWYGPQDARFGWPETYRIAYAGSLAGEGTGADQGFWTTSSPMSEVHESRLIRMDGALTSLTRRLQNDGWSESILEKVDEVLTQFGATWQGVTHLMHDASQGVYKVKGLMEIMAGGSCEEMKSRMELVDMSRSVARAIIVDAETEDFQRVNYAFTGIPEMLRVFILRLASAARMPVTVLMGESPKGLNATGESDIRLWYDRVQAYQTHDLGPAIQRFWELVFAADDFDEETPEDWEVQFNRLWQMTDIEQANLEKMTAEKDKIYMDSGVLLPEEVTLSRHTSRGFSQETQVDLDARREMLEMELKLAKEQAGQPPPDPMEMMGQGNGGDGDGNGDEDPEGREDTLRLDYISKEGNKWVVRSKSGKKLGEHDTEKDAKRQLRAVEARKSAKR